MPYLPMFRILLYGFDTLYMIYLELTPTDVVLSRITVVLFSVQKMKVLGIARNFFVIFSGGNKEHWNEEPPEGGHPWVTSQKATPPGGHSVICVGVHVAPFDVIPTLK